MRRYYLIIDSYLIWIFINTRYLTEASAAGRLLSAASSNSSLGSSEEDLRPTSPFRGTSPDHSRCSSPRRHAPTSGHTSPAPGASRRYGHPTSPDYPPSGSSTPRRRNSNTSDIPVSNSIFFYKITN